MTCWGTRYTPRLLSRKVDPARPCARCRHAVGFGAAECRGEAYCPACSALHVGRRCVRCGAVGCGHSVWDCRECGQYVCFLSDHSVRVAGRTACLGCARERGDPRARVVALFAHLPAGIVRAVAGVLSRSTPYAEALECAAAQWPACRTCRVRAPDLPRGPCECRVCGRASKLNRARCAGCRAAWSCGACRAGRRAVDPPSARRT